MLNAIFSSVFTETTAAFTFGQFLACTAVSLILGLLIAAVYRYKSECTKSFAVTLVLMPVIVQMVIMLVNGNLGTGVAVAGAFSLVRFRSAPGSAKEISSIFLAMAVGLATGMGFLGTAAAFAIIVEAVWFILVQTNFGEKKEKEKKQKKRDRRSRQPASCIIAGFRRMRHSSDIFQLCQYRIRQYRVNRRNICRQRGYHIREHRFGKCNGKCFRY